jgi:biopolymer transport protein ExbD
MTQQRDEFDAFLNAARASDGNEETALDDGQQQVRLSRRRRGGSGGGGTSLSLSLTSMIDVVFLLLTYFMVATDFKAREEVYKLDLPQRMSSAAAADPFDLDVEPLRVQVATVGKSLDNYRITLDGPYDQPVSFQQFYEFLRDSQIGTSTSGGLFESNHPIIITPTGTTVWQHAIEIFNAAARARYTNITFAKSN